MLGEFQPMVGAPIAPCWLSAGSLCEAAHPPLADGLAQGTQLLFLESFFFFWFSKIASYDQHLISARVPEDHSKDGFYSHRRAVAQTA